MVRTTINSTNRLISLLVSERSFIFILLRCGNSSPINLLILTVINRFLFVLHSFHL